MLKSIKEKEFIPYALGDFLNRILMTAAICIGIASWVIYKRFYPNPNLIFDSYYYIYAAYFNDNVSAWPVGFSKILRLIGIFTHKVDTLLVIQYIFLQLSFLYFLLSVRYFFHLSKVSTIVLFVFLFLNPIYLYTCNLVLSDAFFLGLSLVWVISFLWIVFRPTAYMILLQAILLLVTFTIRHSALFYPVIGAVAFLICRQTVLFKLVGVILPFTLIGAFMAYTTFLNNEQFGVKQFSPFQGWKVASNSLYIYEHVPENKIKPVPNSFKAIDSTVRQYYHSNHYPVSIFSPDPSWGSYYMFMYPSPLLTFRDKQFGPEKNFLINVRTLAKLGPLYKAYGSYLLREYPVEYVRYFVLPNVYIYMMPYPEVYFDSINPFHIQQDTLGKIASRWFGKFSLDAPKQYIDFRSNFFNHYPLLNTFTHLLFVISFCGFLFLNGFKRVKKEIAKAIYVISILWGINFVFIVLASASLLRYQLFITVIEFTFMVFFVEYIMWSDNNNYPLLRKDS